MEQNISERTRRARKAGIASFIGTTIEWYDFYAYSTAAALVLGKLFFPATDPGTATLAAFATFLGGVFCQTCRRDFLWPSGRPYRPQKDTGSDTSVNGMLYNFDRIFTGI